MAEGIHRVEYLESPKRCQGITHHGQCTLERVENSSFCRMHGGATTEKKNERKAVRNLHLARIHADMELKQEAPDIKSLRDEVCLLRVLLEKLVNSCVDDTELLLRSGKISDLVMKVEKLVFSCHRLEGSMGKLLDKQVVLDYANRIVQGLSVKILDKDLLEEVTEYIIGLLTMDAQE